MNEDDLTSSYTTYTIESPRLWPELTPKPCGCAALDGYVVRDTILLGRYSCTACGKSWIGEWKA